MLKFCQQRSVVTTPKVTDQDVLDVIAAFSFSATPKVITEDHKKINDLCRVLNRDTLPVSIIRDIGVTPYERDCEIKSKSPLWRDNRVNVTSISMNKKYCELKSIFRLYGNLPRDYSKAMTRGNVIHKTFELKVHEQVNVNLIDDETNLNELVGLDFDESVFHVLEDPSVEHGTDSGISVLIQDQLTSDVDTTVEPEVNDQSYLLVQEPNEDEIIEGVAPVVLSGINMVNNTQLTKADIEEDKRLIHLQNLEEFKHDSNQFIITLQLLFGRLTKLFSTGKAREIRVFGHFDTKNNQLLSLDNQFSGVNNDYITISGIVDQLEINAANDGSLEAYLEEISHLKYVNDFEDWFPSVSKIFRTWDDELNVSIRELKTSGRSFIPNDAIQSAYDQVLIYNKLLRILSSDINTDFRNYSMNCEKRSVNIYEPLPIDLIKFIGISNKFLFNDFLKLKRGEDLNFGDDTLNTLINDKISNSGVISIPNIDNDVIEVKDFYGDWVKVPTTAHIIGRIVQMSSMIKMSNEMSIDFHVVSENDEKEFRKYYSAKLSNDVITDGMKLWLGGRDPLPTVYPNVCNSCPFQNYCEAGKKLSES